MPSWVLFRSGLVFVQAVPCWQILPSRLQFVDSHHSTVRSLSCGKLLDCWVGPNDNMHWYNRLRSLSCGKLLDCWVGPNDYMHWYNRFRSLPCGKFLVIWHRPNGYVHRLRCGQME